DRKKPWKNRDISESDYCKTNSFMDRIPAPLLEKPRENRPKSRFFTEVAAAEDVHCSGRETFAERNKFATKAVGACKGDVGNSLGKLNDPGKPPPRRLVILPRQLRTSPYGACTSEQECRNIKRFRLPIDEEILIVCSWTLGGLDDMLEAIRTEPW